MTGLASNRCNTEKDYAEIVARLHCEIVKAVRNPEAKEKLFITGVEAAGTTSMEFAALIKSDMTRMHERQV